jgi:hypothetical protein
MVSNNALRTLLANPTSHTSTILALLAVAKYCPFFHGDHANALILKELAPLGLVWCVASSE